ncbi:NADH-quinone oxidoreductase subunit NuoE [Limisalsivibrio acetivorans]|uniref:NADH-quinone oxidoreductase subunit NuoE n=1 Tax=Limisalsivibrio acetivorans TaxID=1304888 RepID=UPI0003B36BDF|nr:NADH-quinone oxidoreductase subunit NuoE [Limisalsivibrio acetivorans]
MAEDKTAVEETAQQIEEEEPERTAEELDWTKCDAICKEYVGMKGSTIPVLQKVQDAYGYLYPEVVERIGENLNISSHVLYGVITFYAQFYTKPRGKYVIRVCRGTACHVSGSGRISEVVNEEFGIHDGETDPDKMFTLEEVSCIGACGMAPVIMVNDNTHGNLTPEESRKIFRDYAAGKYEEEE